MEIWGRSVKVTTLFMGRLRPPMRLNITSISAHTFASNPSPISRMRNEKEWPDWASNLGPLARKSDTEHDVYSKFQCLLNALFCEPTEMCKYKQKLYM